MTATIVDVPLGTTATQLQTMIDAASEGTTFRLQAGSYVFDKTVVINQSFVSLIGAGSGQTTIVAAKALGAEPAIQVGHALYVPVIEASYHITAPAVTGATSIEVEAGHSLQVGDVLYIAAANTPEFLASIGDTNWQQSNPLRTLMVEVTEVNGTTVSFDSPLTFDYDPAITLVEKRTVLEGNTLSGFTVAGSYGVPDPSKFSNVISSGKDGITIMIGGTDGMTVSDIAILNAVSNGILVSDSIDMALTGFSMDGAFNKGAEGNGYGLWLREVYDSAFSDLSIVNTRHAVVFASYTTESGNVLQVTYTNRDINFHGGQDQRNVVVVDLSLRNTEEQTYLAPATFFNPGTVYGAPTDPTKNSITFRQVVASDQGDTIYSHAAGSTVATVDGCDTVHSASGADVIDGGADDDVIYASGGSDVVTGGSGNDRMLFANAITSYLLTRDIDTLVVTGAQGTTRVTGVETVSFGDTSYSLAGLFAAISIGLPPSPDAGTVGGAVAPGGTVTWTEMDASCLPVFNGTSAWERKSAALSFAMGAGLDDATLTGTGGFILLGNGLTNQIAGNAAANRMEGRSGHDRVAGAAGDDTLLGGLGNDTVDGGFGDDALAGGAGSDRVTGGDGDDLILAGTGLDSIFGGNGTDIVQFSGDLTDYLVSRSSGAFVISVGTHRTSVSTVENFDFNGTLYSATTLMDAYVAATGGEGGGSGGSVIGGDNATPWHEVDATGLVFVSGASGYQRFYSDMSVTLGNWLEAVTLKGTLDTMALGNAGANSLIGNDGSNRLEGRGANDTLEGGKGEDSLIGGAGDDRLDGGDGVDLLSGGSGDDKIKGGQGADTFVFLSGFGQDVIEDFQAGIDSLVLGLAGVAARSDLSGIVFQAGSDVIFAFELGTSLIVENAQVNDVLRDMIFV